jgi:hypothetical protein
MGLTETGVRLTMGKAVFLNTVDRETYCCYSITCAWGPFRWAVSCRFSEIIELHEMIRTEATELGIEPPSAGSAFSLFRPKHETRRSVLDQREKDVYAYLQTLVGTRRLWSLIHVREFFEVSARSFDPLLGQKIKEGSVVLSDSRSELTPTYQPPLPTCAFPSLCYLHVQGFLRLETALVDA